MVSESGNGWGPDSLVFSVQPRSKAGGMTLVFLLFYCCSHINGIRFLVLSVFPRSHPSIWTPEFVELRWKNIKTPKDRDEAITEPKVFRECSSFFPPFLFERFPFRRNLKIGVVQPRNSVTPGQPYVGWLSQALTVSSSSHIVTPLVVVWRYQHSDSSRGHSRWGYQEDSESDTGLPDLGQNRHIGQFSLLPKRVTMRLRKKYASFGWL